MKDVHLSDGQFAEALGGEQSPEILTHLQDCSGCREELGRVGAALAEMGQWTRAAADKMPGFWYAQRRAIVEQVAVQRRPARLWAWSGAMATLLLAAALLAQMSVHKAVQQAAGSGQAAPVDPDHALMLEIEDSLRRPVPRAFEPALLVTQELSRAAESVQSQP